jgi:hypothetical protein
MARRREVEFPHEVAPPAIESPVVDDGLERELAIFMAGADTATRLHQADESEWAPPARPPTAVDNPDP